MARRKGTQATAPRMTVATSLRGMVAAGADGAGIRCKACGQPVSDRSAHCLRLEVSPRAVPRSGGEPVTIEARIACGGCATVNTVWFLMSDLGPSGNKMLALASVVSNGVCFERGGSHAR